MRHREKLRCARSAVALLTLVCFAGCEQRRGDAIVISKEHIAAKDAAASAASPAQAQSSTESGDEAVEVRPMRDDEIEADGYVMSAADRGTGRDPRAQKEEQWLVRVRMEEDGRTIKVQAEQAQFEKLKEGDRVRVRYQTGKYTGSIWGAEIERTE